LPFPLRGLSGPHAANIAACIRVEFGGPAIYFPVAGYPFPDGADILS
jgi:hypothetical protein